MKKIALVLALALCAVILSGCAEINSLVSGVTGGNFKGGNAVITDKIENLNINWTAGSVKIAYHAENTVTLEETASRAISDDDRLQWKVEGSTLQVQYNKPGIRLNTPAKNLVITLPEGTVLKSAVIGATSAEIDIPSITADSVSLDSTSGDITASVTAPDVAARSTSGDVKLIVRGKIRSLNLNSTSGSLSADLDEAEKITARSTSGRISITADRAGDLSAGSTSGNIFISLKRFDNAAVSATSGDVTAELPAEPGFTLKHNATSGKMSTDIPLAGSKGSYTCGDGSAKITIGTTSGDLTIRPAR